MCLFMFMLFYLQLSMLTTRENKEEKKHYYL